MRKSRYLFLVGLVVLFVFSLCLKVMIKNHAISWQFLDKLVSGDSSALFIFYNLRLPPLIAAISCSCLIVIATFILQALSHNDLADPSALGYHHIAVTVLAIIYLYIPAAQNLNYVQIILMTTLCIFIFSLVMYRLSQSKQGEMNTNLLLLMGIGLNVFFQMILAYIKTYSSEATDLLSMLMQGNFDHLSLSFALWLMLLTGIVSCIFLFNLDRLRLLQIGNELGYSLGLNLTFSQFFFFMIMSVSIAICLMFGGTFPFIGLTAIHLTKNFYGYNIKLHLLSSILFTVSMILLSDLLAHQLFSIVLPTNIFLGLFGGIGFLVILIQRRSKQWQSM